MDWLFLTREMAVLPLVKRDRWREFLSLFVCLFILPQQLATSKWRFQNEPRKLPADCSNCPPAIFPPPMQIKSCYNLVIIYNM